MLFLSKFLISKKYREIIIFICLIILSSILFFTNLNKAPIQTWDETVNINVVRDTASLGSSTVLYQGSSEFLEKPPLWYFLTAALVQIFGDHLFVYRLISSICGLGITMIIFFIFPKEYSFYQKVLASLSFLAVNQIIIPHASSIFSSHTFRSADVDALQIFWLMLAIFTILKVRNQHLAWYLACLSLGLAFLVKGPLALIFLIVLSIYKLRNTNQDNFVFKHLVLGLVIFLIIVLPWHMWMYVHYYTIFLREYFVYHQVQRFFMPLEGHEQNLWFYLRIFFNFNINPMWPIVLMVTLHWHKLMHYSLFKLALQLFTVTMILLCVMQTKLAWYLLAIYPLTALLASYYLNLNLAKRHKWLGFVIYFGFLILGIVQNLIYVMGV